MVEIMDSSDTVIVLGAGASRDCGAPLIENFLSTSFSLRLLQQLNKEEKEKFISIKQFWEKTLPNSNIEELFSWVSFSRNFPVVDTDYTYEKSIIFDNLNFLIFKTLYLTLTDKSEEKLKARNAYLNMIRQYPKSTFITFNWDILLEQAYIKFNKREYIDIDHFGFREETKFPLILKLHGSIDWFYCNNCKQTQVLNKKEHESPHEEACPDCSEKGKNQSLIPIRILPIIEKLSAIRQFERGTFASIFRHARASIVNATKMIIIGYSFSSADLHSHLFFKKNMISNPNLNEVIIVTPKEDIFLEQRVMDLLGFKDYVKECEIREDPTLNIKEIIIRKPHRDTSCQIHVRFEYKSFSTYFTLCP